ncbi:MAG: hypothetical protein RQ824_12345 [bacterium]|nr:hypothetical protein [bacterium]
MIFELADLECEIKKIDKLISPADNPVIIENISKLEEACHWHPEITFEDAITGLYNYWLDKV